MRPALLPAILLAAVPCTGTAQGKTRPAPSPEDAIPRVTLEFGKPEPTVLPSHPAMMFGDTACRADGTLFVGMSDAANGGSFPPASLRSLDPEGQVVRFEPGNVAGYSSVYWVGKFFAGEHWVAILVSATPRSTETDQVKIAQSVVQLALIYDGKGTLQRAVRLPDGIQIHALGVYDSGELLIVASGADNKLARLLVVDADGDTDGELRLFDEDYNSKPHAREDQLFSGMEQVKSGALTSMAILPFGQDLLLFPAMTRQPVIEVNERGIVRVYPLQIPKGFMLRSMLSMSGHTWKIATFTDHIEPDKSADGGPPQSYALTQGPVFEFDPSSGAALRRIDTPKDALPNSLDCEHDGEYTVLAWDPKKGYEVLKASIPR